MSIFEKYNVTPSELGITSETEIDHDSPLLVALAKATVAARSSYLAWRIWNGGRTKSEFYKEDQKRKQKHEEDEEERLRTHEALQLSLNPEAYLEAKRLEKEAEEQAFNDQIQADLDGSCDE